MYAIGGNLEAPAPPESRSTAVRIGVFCVAGALAAVGGLMTAGEVLTVTANQGNNLIFTVFAAAVIGGIELDGGRGRMVGAFTGVVLLGLVNDVLVCGTRRPSGSTPSPARSSCSRSGSRAWSQSSGRERETRGKDLHHHRCRLGHRPRRRAPVRVGGGDRRGGATSTASAEGVTHRVDVGDEARTVALAKAVVEEHGRIDVLLNNAGIAGVGDVGETSLELWEKVMRVNARGVFLMSRAVVPAMVGQRSGSIVNMSSAIAETGLARRVSYAASKGAVLALTKSMQVDLAPHGVRVNALLPGTIMTPFVERYLVESYADPEEGRRVDPVASARPAISVEPKTSPMRLSTSPPTSRGSSWLGPGGRRRPVGGQGLAPTR